MYGKGIADVFVANARKLGLEIVGHDGVESVDVDFRGLLTKVKASGADFIYGGFVIDSGGVQVLQQMKALGSCQKVKFMGPDGLYSPAMIEQATPAAVNDNAYVTFAALPPDKLPTDVGKRFYKDYLETYRSEPIGWAMYTSQATLVALDAIARRQEGPCGHPGGGTPDQRFQGVTGKFSFDENGGTNRTDMVGWAVKDGKFVYAETESAPPCSASEGGSAWGGRNAECGTTMTALEVFSQQADQRLHHGVVPGPHCPGLYHGVWAH